MFAADNKPMPARPHNRLLALCSDADYALLQPHLKPVQLAYKQVLYTPLMPIDYVYFLESGVASLVKTMKNGDAAEVGTIGNEGIIGLPVVFGDTLAPSGIYMQVPGAGLRMPAHIFAQLLERSTTLRTALQRYAAAFFNQVAQSAACAAFHPIQKRCCRWLLMTHDRMPSNEFLLTQEFLAMMLGVRRSSINAAMSKLQRKGFVRYRRGHVTILDRKALEAASCECYQATRDEFDRLMGVVAT
jgi:CRP-like cAMP-binding protein